MGRRIKTSEFKDKKIKILTRSQKILTTISCVIAFLFLALHEFIPYPIYVLYLAPWAIAIVYITWNYSFSGETLEEVEE